METNRSVAGRAWASVLVLVPAVWMSTHVLAQGPPQLPPQAAPPAQVQVEGELEVLVEDGVESSRVHHFLTTSQGVLKLEFTGEPPGLQSGDRVRARGRFKDAGTLELGSGNDVEAMALANANTLGEQRTIVILINFQDSPGIPYDPAHASNVTFGTTSSFFLENSHNQTWLTGDVAGWFTVPLSSSTCDYNQISSAADQAAASGGVRLSNYTRKVYAFPQTGACGWWGLGTVGGNPSRAWINGSFSLKVVAHELGHNLGDYHSRSKACDGASCSVSEYGDDADVMGNPTSGHMNAFQKERLGWLNYGDTPAILNVGSSGSYWIDAYAPINPASAQPKALKVLKEVDGSGRRTWYYVESRTRSGFDSGVGAGVILHTGSETSGREVYEIDVVPTTSTTDWRLDPGQTFEDSALGLRITTLWADATGAMIDVQFEAAPCSAVEPGLTVSPSATVSTSAGAPVTFNLSVSNRDGASCGSSSFGIEAWVPSGWSWSASPASITVAAGGSAGASVTITPAATASGASDIQVGAFRSSGPGATAVRTVDVVSAPRTAGPLALSLGVAEERRGGGFSFSALVTAGGSPLAGATVEMTLVDPGGAIVRTFSATTGSDGVATASFKPRRKDPTGTYTLEGTASASGSSAGATVRFVVN